MNSGLSLERQPKIIRKNGWHIFKDIIFRLCGVPPFAAVTTKSYRLSTAFYARHLIFAWRPSVGLSLTLVDGDYTVQQRYTRQHAVRCLGYLQPKPTQLVISCDPEVELYWARPVGYEECGALHIVGSNINTTKTTVYPQRWRRRIKDSNNHKDDIAHHYIA